MDHALRLNARAPSPRDPEAELAEVVRLARVAALDLRDERLLNMLGVFDGEPERDWLKGALRSAFRADAGLGGVRETDLKAPVVAACVAVVRRTLHSWRREPALHWELSAHLERFENLARLPLLPTRQRQGESARTELDQFPGFGSARRPGSSRVPSRCDRSMPPSRLLRAPHSGTPCSRSCPTSANCGSSRPSRSSSFATPWGGSRWLNPRRHARRERSSPRKPNTRLGRRQASRRPRLAGAQASAGPRGARPARDRGALRGRPVLEGVGVDQIEVEARCPRDGVNPVRRLVREVDGDLHFQERLQRTEAGVDLAPTLGQGGRRPPGGASSQDVALNVDQILKAKGPRNARRSGVLA